MFKIYFEDYFGNKHFMEKVKTRSEAEAFVRIQQRQDALDEAEYGKHAFQTPYHIVETTRGRKKA